MTRVAVTGLGPVSSIGTGPATFAAALFAGSSGIAPITRFDPSGFPVQAAGEVPDFDPAAHLRRLNPAEWGHASLLAAVAARIAAADGGLDPALIDPGRGHAVIGTTAGESTVIETLSEQIAAGGYAAQDAGLLRRLPAGRLANAVSRELGLDGESMTVASACAAGNYAIGYGYDLLVSGDAEVVFAGGADSVCRWVHAGFFRMGGLSDGACAPFDRDRTGMLTAEGGAVMLLETFEHARARGAKIYAELLGYGMTCDAFHPVTPDRAGQAACMRAAHRDAGIKPDEVDYICAHGTGTKVGDLAEGRAILEVFGDSPPPVSSVKSMLGHTMGTACAFGAIACALAIDRALLPPTVNWRHPDPELPGLDPVPNVARPAGIGIAQNNGFAFGGNNATVLLGRPK